MRTNRVRLRQVLLKKVCTGIVSDALRLPYVAVRGGDGGQSDTVLNINKRRRCNPALCRAFGRQLIRPVSVTTSR